MHRTNGYSDWDPVTCQRHDAGLRLYVVTANVRRLEVVEQGTFAWITLELGWHALYQTLASAELCSPKLRLRLSQRDVKTAAKLLIRHFRAVREAANSR